MSQSLSKIYIHLIFSTKGRTDTIPKQHLNEVHAYIAGILNDNHCPAIIVGGTANHIHILYIQSKTMTLSETVKLIKASSSKWINQKNSVFNQFAWQEGYGAFSISQSHVDAVRQYIAGQEQHHATVSFQDELRRICQLYNVDLNERFAWD